MSARADTLAVHTTVPAEPSFAGLIERVRLVAAWDGYPFAQATMCWTIWNRVIATAAMVASAQALGKMTVTFELSRSEDPMSDDVRAADGLRLACTDAGQLVIEFLDGDGAVFAFALLTAEQMSTFIGQSCDLLEVVSRGGLATVACAGAA